MPVVRVGKSPNGAPVFIIDGMSKDLGRPFGALYNEGLWMYPAFYPAHKKVLKDFEAIESEIEFSEATKAWISKLDEIDVKYRNCILPENFEFITKPFDHQYLGLSHIYYNHRAALFYAPGLGKSKIAIDLMRLLRQEGQKNMFLILGPVVTIKNWGKEIDMHSGGLLKWKAVLGTKEKKFKIIEASKEGTDILLLTYDTGRNVYEKIIEEVPYSVVIADESHLIKSIRSTKTKTAIEMARKAERRIIMSGTPTLGDPRDLYGQFKFLGDCFMPENVVQYENKFLTHAPWHKHVVLGYKNLDVLNKRVQDISIRKTKEECLDLPDQTIIDVGFSLSKKQIALYNKLILEMGSDLTEFIEAARMGRAPTGLSMEHVAVLLNKLLQISSGFVIPSKTPENMDPAPEFFAENPKADALEELLDSILAEKSNKVIIWCKYRADLDALEGRLEKRKENFVRVDGTTGSKIQTQVDKFNEDPECRIYLAQISTGVGITLNAANYSIYYSLDWSLGTYLQSLDRNYRIGQDKKVTVYRLLGNGSIDWSIAKLLSMKVDVDKTLTTKATCITCPNSMTCFANDIRLFDPDCIYQKNVARPVTKALTILGD